MKLLVVTPWPLASHGGGQYVARGLVEGLTAHGLQVVAAAGSDWPPQEIAPWEGVAREVRLRLHRLGPAPGETQLDGLESVAAAERPDIILFPSHWGGCAEQAARAAARFNLPFVLCPAVHLDVREHTTRAARRGYRAAHWLLSLTETEREWLVRTAGAAPGRVLPLACGSSVAAMPQSATRPERLHLLSVSAFTRHKQIDHQIEALRLLQDRYGVRATLTIAGRRGDGRTLDELRELARRHALEPLVRFAVETPGEHFASLHATADAFLFTSRSESFGVAVLEAIASGTWPIAYPHPTTQALISSAAFGEVTSHATPAALAAAIDRFATRRPVVDDARRRSWVDARTWTAAVAPLVQALATSVMRA